MTRLQVVSALTQLAELGSVRSDPAMLEALRLAIRYVKEAKAIKTEGEE